ncbi:UPF0439 protein C9orf30 [Acromyrmex echinatior]|uniref:Regulatory protein zeste n=1 Tax=Acromyrmex echinatior TaxID=103372 RepID=F4WUM1_ACREC|nr:UPF0439 protein C9orf30 [Acromyrmex echinatior]
MGNKLQRKRARNFSEAKEMILINLVQYKDTLENKESDSVISKDTEKCWKIIKHSFNSKFSDECRNSEVLKNCWDNLKKTRKFFADGRLLLRCLNI